MRCTVKGCRHEVHALTGFQEAQKLGNHLHRKHKARLTMLGVLEVLERMEKGEEATVTDGGVVEFVTRTAPEAAKRARRRKA